MKFFNHNKEISLLFFAFVFLTIIAISSKVYSNYLEKAQNKVFNDLYNHPLKVSNTALKIQLNIHKIHLVLHHIALSPNKEKLEISIDQLEVLQEETYDYFEIIKINILGEEGRKILQETLTYFKKWKSIQNNIMISSKNNNFNKSIEILESDGDKYILRLTTEVSKLYKYANIKAVSFKENSNEIFDFQQNINIYLTFFILIIFIIVAYFSISQLYSYLSKNRKLTNNLKKKSKEFETIIKEAPNPIILHNEEGNVLMLNKAWTDISGYTQKEITTIDRWVDSVYKDLDTQKTVKKHISGLYDITKKINEGTFSFFTKNNKKVTWQVSSSPLGIIDGKRTIITSAMDITELKDKDEMIITQSRHAAMGEMIGMIAHQWRQPISIIAMDANNMLVDIALDSFDVNTVESYAKNITSQTQHLSQTIDDFRNFFKPDKKILEVNLSKIMDDTFVIVKDSIKNNNIELITTFETERLIKAYPRELMQVFVNIITNAKDALITTKPKNPKINIRVYEDEKYINTEIFDNGGGVDISILSKIFDPYFSTKDEKNGTGLGLYMCKMIIENHLNGSIKVSNKQEGACFTIRLLKNVEGKKENE